MYETSKTKIIGGREYEVQILPFRKLRAVGVRLANVFGHGLVNLKIEGGDFKALEGSMLSGFANGAGGILTHLKDEDLEYLVQVFGPVSTVDVDGTKVGILGVYDVFFRGKMADHFQWLWFCVEAHFGEGFAGVIATLRSAIAADSKPQAEAKA